MLSTRVKNCKENIVSTKIIYLINIKAATCNTLLRGTYCCFAEAYRYAVHTCTNYVLFLLLYK